jgi:hypothetical protein
MGSVLRRAGVKRKSMVGGRGQGDSIARAALRVAALARLCLALVLFASMQLPAFGGGQHERSFAGFAPSGARDNCADRAPDAPAPIQSNHGTPHFCLACVACEIGGAAPAASPVIEMRVFSGAAEPKRASADRFDVSDYGALGWSARAPPYFR